MIACAQALHLLCQGLRGDVVPLACPDQRGRGLRPGEEIPLIEFGIGAYGSVLCICKFLLILIADRVIIRPACWIPANEDWTI